MGKKSKSSSFATKYRARDAAAEKAFDPKASRHARLETEDDAFAQDGEDAFHRNRDTVLFEDQGRRGAGDLDDVSDPDEIYGLNLPGAGSESEDDIAEDDDDELEDEDDDDDMYDAKGNLKSTSKLTTDEPRGRFAKTANPSQDIISDDDDDNSDDDLATAGADDGSDRESIPANSDSDGEDTWAPGSYHASRRAPGEADSEDDEALELEANEARRLQQLAKGKLGGEDYGFDAEGEAEGTADEVRKAAREKVRLEEEGDKGEVAAGGKMTEEEAIAHLVRNSPETLALLDDFAATAQRMESVEKDLDIVRKGQDDGREHPALAIMELEHQALSTYLPTLAFYFSLLLQPVPPAELITKVVHRLSALRKSLATMEELDLTSAPINDYEDESGSECASDCEEHDHGSDDGSDEEESDEEMLASEMWDLNGGADLGEDDDAEMLAELDGESGSDEDEDDDELEDDEEMMDEDGYDSEAEAEMEENLMQMSNDELEMLKADMAGDEDAEMLIATVNRVQRRKAGLPSDDDEDDSEHEPTPPPVSTKKSKKRGPAPAEIPTLAPLASSSKPSKRAAGPSQANDDFVDPQALSRTDASDKASKKHTLRFHVSQVNQRQHKRENANAARIGGDDDLPRRSKERSRREVLKRQEHGGQAGEALDGAEWDESDRRMAEAVKGKAAEVEGGADDDDGDYYDLVKMSKEEGRAAKKAKYDDERLAERDEIVALANGEAGVGPRAASKMIIKNKGLTPRRKKENRNSRVKKRLQYDKAQKKVASMKPTYKGPGAGANYAGETSGISSRNVRAIRLAK